jgi:hypothetical protein
VGLPVGKDDGTVEPVLAELDGGEPENVPGLVVELGPVLAPVVGISELEDGSLGRVVGDVDGVEVEEKPLPPPLRADNPDDPDDPEELLPRPAPDEPGAPVDGDEVEVKLLLPLPDNPEEPEELRPRPPPGEADGEEVEVKLLLPLAPDNPEEPEELLPRPAPDEPDEPDDGLEPDGVELGEKLLLPLAPDNPEEPEELLPRPLFPVELDAPACPLLPPLDDPGLPDDGLLVCVLAPAEGLDVPDPLLPPVYPVGPLPRKSPVVEAVVNLPDPVAVNPPVPATV